MKSPLDLLKRRYNYNDNSFENKFEYTQDIHWLVAEIDELRKEVDALIQGHAGDKATVKSVGTENIVLRKDNEIATNLLNERTQEYEKLRKENERLKKDPLNEDEKEWLRSKGREMGELRSALKEAAEWIKTIDSDEAEKFLDNLKPLVTND